MPDIDLSQPLPDPAHEGIRVATNQAIADGLTNRSDTSDSLYLTDILFELLDDLTARVTALENPTP